jgi:hypothetical protein
MQCRGGSEQLSFRTVYKFTCFCRESQYLIGRKLLGVLLTLALVVGLIPGMSLTALAWDGDPYASLLNI